MSLNNPWLTPYQRSYDAIKSQLILKLKQNVPQLTDLSEGNIFILILSVLAAIAEVLHYYIDSTAREMFFTTARRYSSLLKHAKLVDYHVKSAIAATVDVYIYRTDANQMGLDFEIPENTPFTSSEGKTFYSSKKVSVKATDYTVKIPLIQRELAADRVNLGTLTSNNSEVYLPDSGTSEKYQEGSMILEITFKNQTDTWRLVDTFAYSTPDDKVYKVELGDNMRPRIIFGQGLYGLRPSVGSTLTATYYYTWGAEGNVAAGSINQLPQVISNMNIPTLVLVQPYNATGGSDYENFDMLKAHVPLSIKTLGVAVTREDFEALAKLHPGVDKAYVNYRCGKFVEVYISPDGGIEASSELRQSLEKSLEKSKVITSNVEVLSTHASQIIMDVEIWGRKSFSYQDIYNQVRRALLVEYGESNSDINKTIHLSDAYSLVDSCSMVDHSLVNKLYLASYWQPQPRNSSDTDYPEVDLDSVKPMGLKIAILKNELISPHPLEIYFMDNGIGTEISSFSFRVGPSNVAIIKPNQPLRELQYDGPDGKLIVQIGTVTKEDLAGYPPVVRYLSYISPNGKDLVPQDYQIPILSPENLTLTIHESI